ncbi:site-specific integrase [Bifidobacterium longum]|uniref:tyrosine-type recombinase/integrase n=1 Tax=Bifidobacterium longum TaxID=216816 RepID=UPI001ADA6695|nr:site-specific integrase [Bifidobacterium longum]QTL69191.1 site-specific integrase [Bifidobacterium longum]QTL76334.1 site-specific integrase [Bifidobacterium longum]
MNETNDMPRYTLTLVDATNQTPPIVLTAESARTIVRQLTKRLDPTPERRRVQGSGGFTTENGRVKAFRELPPDPATGKRRRVTAFGGTKAEAELRLNGKLAELQRVGQLGYVKPPTVAEWMDHWLTDVCKPRLKPRTWGTYASVSANNIVPSIGAVRLDGLKPAHFRRMERYVTVELGKSSGTAGSAWRTLHKALEDAVLEGVIERNPAVKGTAPRVALKERAALTPDQAADLIAAETDETWRLMWMLAFMTGMRQGERLGLTEDELRRDGDRLVVLVEWQAQHLTKREVEGLPKGVECSPLGNGMYRTRPKTEKGRRAIPLPDALARVLLAHIERHGVNGDGLVFHDEKGLPLTGNVERRRWYRALDRIGLDHDYVPHSARHTTATILNRLGLDDVTRTAIMGHSRVSTTNEIYTHVELDRLVAATDGVEKAIEG